MNTLETILLTSLINVLITGFVGGFVIYRIQKKIDATIQKSLFEYQTRFSAVHSKRIETLEILYQKFIRYKSDFDDMLKNSMRIDYIDKYGKIRLRKYSSNEGFVKQISSVVSKRIAQIENNFLDFKKYFEKNRIFLSPDACFEIDYILSRYHKIDWALQIYLNDIPDSGLDFARRYILELFEIDLTIDLERPEYLTLMIKLIYRLSEELELQEKKLEELYKSVAEVK